MSFIDEGFLSSETAMVERFRRDHAARFELADRLNRLGMRLLTKTRTYDAQQQLVRGLFSRAVSNFQGAVLMAERGMTAEAVNVETTDQAQQRQDRADATQEATAAQAANTNIAASLTRQLDGLRPLAVDVAGRQLEAAGIVAKLEDGREVVVDLADIRKALAVEPVNSPETGEFTEAAE